mgnify:CR=1 FL=1
MKTALIYIASFLATHIALANTTPEVLFQKAKQHYDNQQFEQAANTYDSILNLGVVSESVFYNKGNAHYKLGEIGYAILNYSKALIQYKNLFCYIPLQLWSRKN